MATIRKWLDQVNFNWNNAHIIHQVTEEEEPPGWSSPINARVIDVDDPILDLDFHSGYGLPECPRFVADDGEYIYFPDQYDGATGITCVAKNINVYLDTSNRSPYPGG